MEPVRPGYIKIATQLRRRYVRACYPPDLYDRWLSGEQTHIDAGWPEVAEWMVSDVRPRIKRTSWNGYTSAVRAVADDLVVDAVFEKARHEKRFSGSQSKPRHSGVSDTEISALEQWISERSLLWGYPALVWLKATVLTGLRPVEWSGATTVLVGQNSTGLLVDTAKQANRSTSIDADSSGDTRVVPLGHLQEHDFEVVRAHLSLWSRYVTSESPGYSRYHKACSNLLLRANHEVWPDRHDRINLYSGRHEFHARCMAGGLSAIEAAVLMGHDSLRSGEHYGRDRIGPNGHNGSLPGTLASRVPRPLPADVDAWQAARKQRLS